MSSESKILKNDMVLETKQNNVGSTTLFYQYEEKQFNNRFLLCPVLYFGYYMQEEDKPNSIPSGMVFETFVGYLNLGFINYLRRGWMLEGDSKTSKFDERKVHPLKNVQVPQSEEGLIPRKSFLQELRELTNKQSFHLVAVLPHTRQADSTNGYEEGNGRVSDTVGKRVQAFHDENRDYAYKWRNDVFLVNYLTWFYGDNGGVSYTLIKDVENHTVDRHFPLDNIVKLMRKWSPEQLSALSPKYPALNFPPALLFWIAVYMRHPALLSSEGIHLSAEDHKILEQSYAGTKFSNETRFRLRENISVENQQKRYTLILEKKDTTSRWVPIRTFTQEVPRPMRP